MTVESTDRKQSFAGGIATLDFTFRALVDSPEDIKVLKTLISTGVDTELTYTTEYTVSIAADGVGGTVTVSPTVSTLYTQTVYRATTNKQESDYDDYNQFPANTLENDLDKRTLISQETDETLDRTIRLPISSSADATMPAPVADTYLGWNAAGDGLENKVLPDPSVLVKASQSVAEAGTNDTDYMTALQVKNEVQKSGAVAIPVANVTGAQATLTKASASQAEAGSDDATYMTPSKTSIAITALAPVLKVKSSGSLSRDLSAAGGDVSYTGVGFTPKSLILFCGVDGASNHSTGIQGAVADNPVVILYASGVGSILNDRLARGTAAAGGSNYQDAVLKSYDADGFTLTWTKTGSPTGSATIGYLAIG
jgi:hypothetical protein